MPARAAAPERTMLPTALLELREEDVRRKGEQRGTLRLRDGVWHAEYRAWVQDEAGDLKWKPVSRKVGVAFGKDRISKRSAERLKDELVAEANGLAKRPQCMLTVAQFIDARFRPDHISKKARGTRDLYESLLSRHILPTIGGVRLVEVSPSMVQTLLNAKRSLGLSDQTIIHIRNLLSAIFRHAIALRFLSEVSPVAAIKLADPVHKKRPALSIEQVLLLAGAMPDLQTRVLVVLLACTGLRIGEALGLKWGRVNLTNEWIVRDGLAIPPNTVYVYEQFTRGEWKVLKTKESERKVAITTLAGVHLLELFEVTKWNGPHQPVFANRKGEPMDAHNLSNRALKVAVEKTGLLGVSFHSLRHSASTLAHLAGLSAIEHQRYLGHARLQTTALYTRTDTEAVRKKMENVQ